VPSREGRAVAIGEDFDGGQKGVQRQAGEAGCGQRRRGRRPDQGRPAEVGPGEGGGGQSRGGRPEAGFDSIWGERKK
jgi:hypothetical protein